MHKLISIYKKLFYFTFLFPYSKIKKINELNFSYKLKSVFEKIKWKDFYKLTYFILIDEARSLFQFTFGFFFYKCLLKKNPNKNLLYFILFYFLSCVTWHVWLEWQRLYQMDARKFVIGNVGPIGCIPYQKTINQLNEDECVDLANKLALQYNARLKDLVAELNDNLPGATFVLANVYDLVLELIKNYDKYGN